MSGQLSIREFKARIVFGIGTKAKQVFFLELSEINIAKIVQLAGDMTDNVQLQSVKGGEDTLVFNDLKLYFSTGAVIFERFYERGIHVTGKVTFFDKTGDFDGRFDDNGLVIKAGLDNFKIGGLEVTSTRADHGVERATMEIEMTSETQRIFIDGMIRYYDFELKILIDADIQKRHFYADVSIKFTDSLSIALKAVAKVENMKTLAGTVVEFEAELNTDIFAAIFDGIQKGIETLAKLATEAIEKAEAELQSQINVNQEMMHKMGIELGRMKLKSDEQVAIRKKQVKEGNMELLEARKQLDRLEKAVKVAEANCQNHKDGINGQKAKRDAAKYKLDNMLREKTQEYNRNIEKEKSFQADLVLQKKILEDKKNASWGDDIRKFEGVMKTINEAEC